jgi:hypothetical protein
MGEVIRFIPRYERERTRLIRRARAIYDSVFPPADPVSEKQNKAPVSHMDCGANTHRSDRTLMIKVIALLCSLSAPAKHGVRPRANAI